MCTLGHCLPDEKSIKRTSKFISIFISLRSLSVRTYVAVAWPTHLSICLDFTLFYLSIHFCFVHKRVCDRKRAREPIQENEINRVKSAQCAYEYRLFIYGFMILLTMALAVESQMVCRLVFLLRIYIYINNKCERLIIRINFNVRYI